MDGWILTWVLKQVSQRFLPGVRPGMVAALGWLRSKGREVDGGGGMGICVAVTGF